MKSVFEQQAEFMRACGQSIPAKPITLSKGTLYALECEPVLRLIGALAIARDHISDIAADLSDDDESRQALMYFGLMLEEFREAVKAFKRGDMVETLDGLIDTHVVTAGAGLSLGLPMDAAWMEVMRSNMSKIDPATGKVIRREDGKIMKPASYSPPNLAAIIHPTQ